MATDQNDVIRAQQQLQSEQSALSTAQSRLKSDPTNTNYQREVEARRFNVSVYQQKLNQVLIEFQEDQGYSYFELANRQEAERQARLDAERRAQEEAQRIAQEEADRIAEEEYQKQILAGLQLEVDRQAEADRQAELQRQREEEERILAEQEAQNNLLPPPLDPSPDYGGFDPIPIPYENPIYEQPPMENPFEELPSPVEPSPIYEPPPTFEQPMNPIELYPENPIPMFEQPSMQNPFGRNDPFSFLQLGGGKKSVSKKSSNRLEGLFTFESLTSFTERKESRKKKKEEDPFAFYGFSQPKATIKKGKSITEDDPFAFLSGAGQLTRRKIAKRSNVLKAEDIFRF